MLTDDSANSNPETQPTLAAPRSSNESVAEVLARMQASGSLNPNFEFCESTPEQLVEESPDSETNSPEQTAATQQAAATEQSPVQTAAVESSDENDVHDYMNRLLGRLQGGDKTAASSDSSDSESEPPVCQPTIENVEKFKPLNPDEYVPKAVAPELQADLAAMRKLANASTRSAVHASQHRQKTARTGLLAAGIPVSLCGAYFAYTMNASFGGMNSLIAGALVLVAATLIGLVCKLAFFDKKTQLDASEEALSE